MPSKQDQDREGCLTAFGLAVEIGDWDRLSGRSIGAYLGLVPTENSSGATRTQGGVTKTGNTHARRLLIEAAWHHRRPYRPGRDLRRRWEAASPAARAQGQAANRRLHARWMGVSKTLVPLRGFCHCDVSARMHPDAEIRSVGRPSAPVNVGAMIDALDQRQ